jgi:glycosyltransferase involved in cell wall biosynthesis
MTFKIAVAMCTFNGSRFVAEQLASISNQTRLPDELVICDDGSDDGTPDIVTAFATDAPFPVRIQVNERRLGSTRNFEAAIALCSGDIIALADQDDRWRADKLSIIESCFLNNPEIGLVFTDAEMVDDHMQPLGCRLWERVGFDEEKKRLIKAGRPLEVLLPGWTVTGATMAFRSSFRELFLPIPGKLAMIHDGWTALVISAVADVVFIEEPLIKYRQHRHQQIGAPAKDQPPASRWEAVQLSLKRVNSYSAAISTAQNLSQRLIERRNGADFQKPLSELAHRIKHLSARANLPEHRFNRAIAIAKELLSSRYHLYSKGINSAAKDFISRSDTLS